MSDAKPRGSIRFLLDTNAFIVLEPASTTPEAALSDGGAGFVALATGGGHRLYLSEGTFHDIAHIKDSTLRKARLLLAQKYAKLEAIPTPQSLLEVLNEKAPNATDPPDNNAIDLGMLVALWQNAVDYLVTDDDRLKRRGGRAGLGRRIFGIHDAESFLRQMLPPKVELPVAVEELLGYQLNSADPIFTSLRHDYAGFDSWFRDKVQHEGRTTWIVRDVLGKNGYGAIAIVKDSLDHEFPSWPGDTYKISTFKVAESSQGRRYGELLLKAIFAWAHARGANQIYLTAFPKHKELVDLVCDFGFEARGHLQESEIVLAKTLRPRTELSSPLSAHVRYGPPYVDPNAKVYLVPIQPRWHEVLFPEAALGLPLDAGSLPYGNALRKAYICHSGNKSLDSGDTLLFYRSDDARSVGVVGVVEDVFRSADPWDVHRKVARRTVYTLDEIHKLTQDGRREVHVTRFRQDRILREPWESDLLLRMNVFSRAPQSIMQVKEDGSRWVHSRLAESH